MRKRKKALWGSLFFCQTYWNLSVCQRKGFFYLLLNLCNSINNATANTISIVKSVIATASAENIHPNIKETTGMMMEKMR